MTTVWVTWRQEGWHRWPLAKEGRAYLASLHRHLFHFRVELEVKGNDREVELHNLLDFCRKALREQWMLYDSAPTAIDFGEMSCEDLAHLMTHLVQTAHKGRWVACEVAEDGECGARVEVRP